MTDMANIHNILMDSLAKKVRIPNIKALLESPIARLEYATKQRFVGLLIHLETGELNNSTVMPSFNDSDRIRVYDTFQEVWVDKYMYEIPTTYTWIQRPADLEAELDYFVRSAYLIKHKFIWASKSLDIDTLCNIRSPRNQEFRGRFSLSSSMPSILDIKRRGLLYFQDEQSANFLFGKGNWVYWDSSDSSDSSNSSDSSSDDDDSDDTEMDAVDDFQQR